MHRTAAALVDQVQQSFGARVPQRGKCLFAFSEIDDSRTARASSCRFSKGALYSLALCIIELDLFKKVQVALFDGAGRSVFERKPSLIARTWSSASWLTTIRLAASDRRWVSCIVTLPRVSRSPASVRAPSSKPSAPDGKRSLMSRPRPLTERTSQNQVTT